MQKDNYTFLLPMKTETPKAIISMKVDTFIEKGIPFSHAVSNDVSSMQT